MEHPLPDRESCHSLQGRREADNAEATLRAKTDEDFDRGSSARVRVESEGDTVAWLAGALAVPRAQGLGTRVRFQSLVGELRPCKPSVWPSLGLPG